AILSDPSLAGPFPELSTALIAFDRPDDSFKPTQTTVDLFLFDLRESLELRNSEPTVRRLNGQAVIRPAPLRLACTYLITAWPVGGPDLVLQEQQLLGEVLQVLSMYPRIPAAYLKGKLVGQEPVLPMTTTHPEELRNPAEFWTAIGSKMRPSITVTVTIGMDVFAPVTAPVVRTGLVRLGERTGGAETLVGATKMEFFRIGGKVTSGGAAVAGASVAVAGAGLSACTDADGDYVLGAMPAGAYTLDVQANATTRQVAITVPAATGHSYDVQL
ncbi:MAG TPA: Pvc16 family protein, partial [Acetobacteraceae bacterium]|nr:Pvc16 family protein [Acetobacteraceae bacterium]